jgi:hypothetical protein
MDDRTRWTTLKEIERLDFVLAELSKEFPS